MRAHRSSRARLLAGALAVTAAVVALPVTPAAAASSHVVKAGDTLWDLARKYGTSPAAIAAANGITNPNVVVVGTRLVIPVPGAPAAATPTPAKPASAPAPAPAPVAAAPAAAAVAGVHVVKAGETLYGIAQRYGVAITTLATFNKITNPNLILIGQRISLPGAAPASAPAPAPAPVAGGTPPAAAVTPTTAYAATGGADGITTLTGTHTVATNETLEIIAKRYGATVEDLAAANGLVPPYRLWSSMRLNLTRPNRLPDNLRTCPVPGGKYMNDFNFPRSEGRYHAGNDLLAPRNTPVLAPVSGIIAYLTGPIGGHQFRLRGDDGNLYIGTHLEAFGKQGWVAAGDTIGYVGNSGNAIYSATHLHFEVHPDRGPAMNPYPLLRAVC